MQNPFGLCAKTNVYNRLLHRLTKITMKQSTFILKSLSLLALSLIFSCQKTDPEPSNYVQPTNPYHTLPEITQEGKNTFGCLMNGVVWVPRVELFVPWYTLDFQFSTHRLAIPRCKVLHNKKYFKMISFVGENIRSNLLLLQS